MLKKLFIQNFALIEKLEIDFFPGFNVMTGETGAGKSIIIDAVGVVVGEQGHTEFIRSGENRAIIEAYFEIEEDKIIGYLDERGFLPQPGEDLILTRELVKNGKNLCRVNGRQVNLSQFKEIAVNLVDIYGQHHQQSLLSPDKHIELLDDFGGNEILILKKKTEELYQVLTMLEVKVKKLKGMEKEQARMADLYKFQLEEIDNTGLRPGEDVILEEEKNLLANCEKLANLSDAAYEILYEGGRSKAAIDLLQEALSSIKEIGNIDPLVAPIIENLETSVFQAEEVAREIKTYFEKIDSDPRRLDEIDGRLNQIKQLKKKYGDTIEEILAFRCEIASSLDVVTNYEEELEKNNRELSAAQREYQQFAEELSEIRSNVSKELIEKITGQLKDLNMPHVTFDILIDKKTSPGPHGTDSVEFLISPNKGEPLKPLAKIVSGGEMSRIMLAFKAVLALQDFIPTLIFDEVDAGIGGNTLDMVSQKLQSIGRSRQVICVTHSAHLAGYADVHFTIDKVQHQDRTVTSVKQISGDERIDEIARMLSGGQITPVTRQHAEEILYSKKSAQKNQL